MKVGIIGSGPVGQSLAKGFIKNGYEVTIGTRHKNKEKEIQEAVGKVKVGSFEDAAKFGEILVLSVKGNQAESIVKSVGIKNFNGKTVLDTSNPIADEPPENGVLKFFTSLNESLMERLQKLAPEAFFVKAFSCVGNQLMVNPDFDGQKPTMFICGNKAEAKKDASDIIQKFGFEVEDMGGVEAARAIEPLCMLWCIPGFKDNQWMHAFKLLKK